MVACKNFLESLYKQGRMTASEIWAEADKENGIISATEAAEICGARPE